MFCLECGAEMAIGTQACRVCGHIYGERERSLAGSPSAAAVQPSPSVSAPTGARAASSATPRVKYVGDAQTPGLPRDLPGRFVLGISLGLAADLLLPWVNVNNNSVTPASIGAPVIVVVALLGAATLPVFTSSLRQHPVWSALPLIIGAFCAGIAGSVWLLLAPLSQIFAVSFVSDPSNLALSPEGGLYLFLLGSAVLLVSGQRMLAAVHASQLADARREAILSVQVRQAPPVRPVAPPNGYTLPPNPWQTSQPAPAAPRAEPIAPSAPTLAPAETEAPVNPAAPALTPTSSTSSAPATPLTPAAPVVPVLPGSEAWSQAPAAPTPLRPSPGSGWGKSRGPQRLR